MKTFRLEGVLGVLRLQIWDGLPWRVGLGLGLAFFLTLGLTSWLRPLICLDNPFLDHPLLTTFLLFSAAFLPHFS